METKEQEVQNIKVDLTLNDLSLIVEALFRYQVNGESFFLSTAVPADRWTPEIRGYFFSLSSEYSRLYDYLNFIYNANRKN